MTAPEVSVVVPVRDNEAALADLAERTARVLEGVGRSFELLLVDDHSTDGSWREIERLAERDDRVRGLRLERQSGQVPAIAAGASRARAEWIVYLDADLEYPPEQIPLLVERLVDGADMVNGVRSPATERPRSRRVISRLSAVIGPMVIHGLRDPGSGFKAWHRDLWDDALRTPWRCRGFVVLHLTAGRAHRIDNIPVVRTPGHGPSSYRIRDLLSMAAELLALAAPIPTSVLLAAGALAASVRTMSRSGSGPVGSILDGVLLATSLAGFGTLVGFQIADRRRRSVPAFVICAETGRGARLATLATPVGEREARHPVVPSPVADRSSHR